MYVFWLHLNLSSFASLYGPQGSEGDPEGIFSLLTHTRQLLLLSFSDHAAGIVANLKCDICMERETDVKSGIVI